MKGWRPERLSNLSEITQPQRDGFDLSSLALESVLLIMILCNLLEPEIGSLLSTFLIPRIINKLFLVSEGMECVGGESAWDKCRGYLSSHAGQKLEFGGGGVKRRSGKKGLGTGSLDNENWVLLGQNMLGDG